MSSKETPETNKDSAPQEPVADYRSQITDYYRHHGNMRPWLIALAAIFLLIILSMWGYAIFQRFSTLSWKQLKESKLVDSAKNNWDTTFEKTKEAQTAKTELSTAIGQIVAAFKASSTTTSSTVTVTSTEILSTTTKTNN